MANPAVVPFPVQTACQICKRPCTDEDLSECTTCGNRMCGRCAWCSCDTMALEIADRAIRALLVPGFTWLADFLSARIQRAERRQGRTA